MNKLPQKAVIPCAGFGTRLLPITKAVPKELLPIGRKPAIHYVVEDLVNAKIHELIFVCNRTVFCPFNYQINIWYRRKSCRVENLSMDCVVKDLSVQI